MIDVHVHLDKLEDSVEVTLQKARDAGVRQVITIGTDPEDLKTVIELAEKNQPYVFCTLGIHPHEGSIYTSSVGQFIRENAHRPYVVAVGEIGLDYYYNHSNKEDQLKAFREQLQIAREVNLPVEIHTRDAEEDTVSILRDFTDVKGLIHCFTGTQWLADRCLELGYNISISGVVTFKNAQPLRDVVKSIPLDRLHIETDAPFLAPVPQRGKSNTPAYVIHTAQVVADIKGISVEKLIEHATENTYRLFSKMTRIAGA